MIVYLDVLIFLNTLVDYFLLLATAKLIGEKTKTFFVVIASFLGGLSSIYIFFPKQLNIVEFFYKTAVAALLSLICFKWRGIRHFLKCTAIFLAISCVYGGIMFALWQIFKPYGMVINNSVVYLSISPLQLVVFSVLGYIAFSVFFKIFKRSNPSAERCTVKVNADGKEILLEAIIDTGNSIEDIFSDSDVIIADKDKVTSLFGSLETAIAGKNASRYRILPCSTVSGDSTLEGFRCEKATVKTSEKTIDLHKPILAVAKTPLKDDYNAIINPNVLR